MLFKLLLEAMLFKLLLEENAMQIYRRLLPPDDRIFISRNLDVSHPTLAMLGKRKIKSGVVS